MSTSDPIAAVGPVDIAPPISPEVIQGLATKFLAESWGVAPTGASPTGIVPTGVPPLVGSGALPGPDSPPQLVPPAPRGEFLRPAPVEFVSVAPEPLEPEPLEPGPIAPGGLGDVDRLLDPGVLPVSGIGWSDRPYTGTIDPEPAGDAPVYGFLTRPRPADPAVAPEPAGPVPASGPADPFGQPVPALPDRAAGEEIFDVTSLRREFPILAEEVNGRPLIWLDNAATTQKPQVVIDRLVHFYEHENSNIHRAAHTLAARATDAYEEARETVRRFIGAARDEEIVFVRGTTEAINLVAESWGAHNLREGDEILITHLEHHANIVPWQIIARRTGARIRVAPVDDHGDLLLDRFADLLGPRTKLVAVTAVSNALGTVTPVEQLVDLAHRAGARVLVDGAQSAPHLPVDVRTLGADFFVFSGHKVYGPTGIGVLYLSEQVWDETPAWQGGGNMIADVTLERSIYREPPHRYEAGTGNIADAVGLATALRFVERIGLPRIATWEERLLAHATPRLAAVPGVRIVGTAPHKASVLSFVLAGHDPLAVGRALDAEGIAVRAGHHCAQPILRRLGLEATVRPSFAFYNTLEEADALVAAVRRIAESSPRR